MSLKIYEGPIKRPQKAVLYGPEGIGKSSLAAKFPDVLFIDTEGGTAQMDVKRLAKPKSWMDLISYVNAVAEEKPCKTLVIDTADWAEQLCIKSVCEELTQKTGKQVKGIEDIGYGKGYTYVAEKFQFLLNLLEDVIRADINVVVTAHAKMRKFEQPDEMGAYDRWEMKLTRQTAPLLKEWADMVLFLNYKTYVMKDSNDKAKASGGKRTMYASHHACWDAKNRHGLADELELNYDNIKHIFEEVK